MQKNLVKFGAFFLAGPLVTSLVLVDVTAEAQAPAPSYTATVTDGSVVMTVDQATIGVTDDRSLQISDRAGALLTTLPLGFVLEGRQGDIRYAISDDAHTVRLTPDMATLRSPVAATDIASPLEEQLALDELATSLTRNTLLGTLAGSAIGALVGAAIGVASCLVVGPGCIATIPAAVVAFAAGGGVAGTLVAGGATLASGLWKYITTRNSPPGQSPYANSDGQQNPDGTGVPDANLRLPSGSAGGIRPGSSGGSSR
ncbi:hypothetical protein ACIRRA_43475 [Nocardia sp. NPDC101769]|uniref:hypothetical protein n=1 Tax=Nocardia sp. NPDC101769 TaxID=3364333 RepID=UPI00380751F2